MHAVVRSYSGPGAKELFDVLEENKSEVQRLMRGVKGSISYTLVRTADGGTSVTVGETKEATDESIKIAADWVKANSSTGAAAPAISEGDTIVHF
jgi:hypothetical protein